MNGIFGKKLLWICLLAINNRLIFSNLENKHKSQHKKCFQHTIKLQLSDSLGFPVPKTEFDVTLDIIKDGPKVIIQFPLINFQTGPMANDPKEILPPNLVPGGYLYTASNFLPKEIRPSDLVYRSTLAASNNGVSLPFSFQQPVDTIATKAPSRLYFTSDKCRCGCCSMCRNIW